MFYGVYVRGVMASLLLTGDILSILIPALVCIIIASLFLPFSSSFLVPHGGGRLGWEVGFSPGRLALEVDFSTST